MKRLVVASVLVALAVPELVLAQTTAVQPAGGKTLAATMNVYVFPNNAQDAAQQSKDESECYSWAVQNTGNDPFALQKQSQQQQQQTQQAKEQAKQVGALIGEVANDDAGKGAAYGAAAGAVAGRRRARAGQAEATKQAEAQGQQAQQATAEQLQNFKKAFSVCLEAKKYMVKY